MPVVFYILGMLSLAAAGWTLFSAGPPQYVVDVVPALAAISAQEQAVTAAAALFLAAVILFSTGAITQVLLQRRDD